MDQDPDIRGDHDGDSSTDPPSQGQTRSTAPGSARPASQPNNVGPFKILEVLGEGGMGVVYLAEQSEPVKRRVALKVIKLGMDTRQVVARFEAERQALAMMNHPNVAKVFGGGETDEGRPYFVMEHVPGVPITEHCDRQRMSINGRLDLFMKVCDAVQHAHQKGIIHRDLKPSNILVSLRDGQPVPKVIDFGVAKAVHQRLTEKTLFTELGQLIGTPEYMSPEQAEMSAQDIDTRSDIYSLGVLLYELLTGALPFDKQTLRSAAYAEIQRIIREVEPSRPSTRLSGLGDESKTSAKNRHAEPRSLVGELRGDLDWIVMRCLEKDRSRRYETANGLAADLKRHLNHEPVLAGPPSAAYRAHKFIRRNRTGVIVASVMAIVMIGATIISGVFAVSEARQRRVAVEALHDRAIALEAELVAKGEAQRRAEEAESERAIAQSINEFLNVRLLGAVAPDREGRDVLVYDMLLAAAAELESDSPAAPRVEAALRQTIGRTFSALGYFKEGEVQLRRAVELWERVDGPESLSVADVLEAHAIALERTGHVKDSYALAQRVLAIRERELGPNHALTERARGDVVQYRGSSRGEVGGGLDDPMALDMIRSVRGKGETREQMRLRLVEIFTDLESLVAEHRLDDAIEYVREVVRPFTENPLLRERVPYALGGFAVRLSRDGSPGAGEAIARYALQSGEELLGPDHPYTLFTLETLANVLWENGRLSEGQQYLARCVAGRRQSLGEDHWDTIRSIANLGEMLQELDELDQADAMFSEAGSRLRDSNYEDAGQRLGKILWHHGQVLVALDRFADAEAAYIESHAVYEKTYGVQHKNTLAVNRLIVGFYEQWHAIDPDAGYDAKAAQRRE